MSVEAEQTSLAEPYSRSSRPWLTSLAVAGLACATVATAAQGTGQFHWWAVFILIPAALIAASGGPLLARAVAGRSPATCWPASAPWCSRWARC
ncbi:hypothetical protein NKG94_41680 [Micromonospora sp. M12]